MSDPIASDGTFKLTIVIESKPFAQKEIGKGSVNQDALIDGLS
jgi:hypothetical protein